MEEILTFAKLRKPFLIDLNFLPDGGFVWVTKVSIPSYSQPTEYSSDFDFSDVNQVASEIGQVYIDNVEYESTSSEASCRLLEKSWYFSSSTQELFFHIDHSKRADAVEFNSLQVRGYCTGEGVFYDDNNFKYEPRLLGGIEISDEVDRLEYQKQSTKSNTLRFDNSQGTFDYAFNEPVPGADVNTLFLAEKDRLAGKKTLTPIYTGFSEGDNPGTSEYSIDVADKREQLNKKIPNTFFDDTTFPDIESDLVGELIPEGYGQRRGLPAFCTNGDVTSGDVTYKYGTDGTILTTVYVKIDEVWTVVTPTATDADNCTFTLATGDGRDSSGRYRESKVDCTLREETNPVDILADMITRYLGKPFNNDYFNIYEWGLERALLSDVGFDLSERKEFFKHVEPLQNGANLGFIFRFDASGKFTLKVDDITRAVSQEFKYVENLNDKRNVETDFTQYATEVVVKYNKDQTDELFDSVTNDSFKEETLDTYRLEKEQEFETLIISEEDAEERAAAIIKDYKKARPKHTIIIRGIIPQPLFDVFIYDSSVYKRGVKIREYAGLVKIKTAAYSFDFERELTTLSGYDISDIISKGTSIYNQGDMYGDGMYGFSDDMFGPSVTYEPEAG